MEESQEIVMNSVPKKKYMICIMDDADCGKTHVANKVWMRLWRKARWGKAVRMSYLEHIDHLVFLGFDTINIGVVTIGDPWSDQETQLDRVARWDVDNKGDVNESPEIIVCTARIERTEHPAYKKPEDIVKDIANKYEYELIWFGNWHIDKNSSLSDQEKKEMNEEFNKMSAKAIIRTIEKLKNVELFDF